MNDSNYTSFLLCFHDGFTNVYQNGLPLGVIRDDKFEIHKHILPDKTEKPVKIDNETLELVSKAVEIVKNRKEN